MDAMDIKVAALAHLVLLGLWGGVVATEAVLELYPRRHAKYHPYTIRAHYWIDMLVELPVLLGVVLSGLVLLVLTWPPTTWHLVKIGCGGLAVCANLYCVRLVIKRSKMLTWDCEDDALWGVSDRISRLAAVAIPLGLAAAALGFWLAYQRMGS